MKILVSFASFVCNQSAYDFCYKEANKCLKPNLITLLPYFEMSRFLLDYFRCIITDRYGLYRNASGAFFCCFRLKRNTLA